MTLGLACVSMVWACTVLNPLDEYGPGNATSSTTRDGGADANGGTADTCQHVTPPTAPASDDAQQNLKLVFALDSLYLGGAPDAGGSAAALGYDLDGVCTCPGAASCRSAPTKTGGDAGPKCDATGGIDNGGTEFIQTIVQSAGSDGDANGKLNDGTRGLLLQVVGYNGGQNDTQVQVTIFATGGTELDGDNNHVVPKHDGTDKWTVRRDSLFGGVGDGPNYIGANRDDHAYVTNGMLVARVEAPLSIGNLDAILRGMIVTGRIVPSGAGYRLEDGHFVGRWTTKDLLTSLAGLQDPVAPGTGLCGSSAIYQQLKTEVCTTVDLRGTSSEDNQSPLLPCNAMGMTMSFTASSALLGTAVDKTAGTQYCGAGYSDDCPTF